MANQPVKTCRHAKVNGSICESPALRDQDYCFFHTSQRQRIRRQRRAVRLGLPFQLPLLEDAASIQLAINDVLNALLAGQIDHKTAGLLLYGLQTAATNMRHAEFKLADYEHQYVVYHERENDLLEQEIAEDIAEEKKLEEVAKKKVERERQREAAKAAAHPAPTPANAPPSADLPAKKPVTGAGVPTEAKVAVGGEPHPGHGRPPSRSDGKK